MEREAIGRGIADLANEVRTYVREQKRLWQRIPSLALAADGNSGYSDQYRMAHESGFWNLADWVLAVDLATGELVTLAGVVGTMEPVSMSDEAVIDLSGSLDRLDAAKIIADLEERARRPHAGFRAEGQVREWREERRVAYGVSDPYTGELRELPRRDVIF